MKQKKIKEFRTSTEIITLKKVEKDEVVSCPCGSENLDMFIGNLIPELAEKYNDTLTAYRIICRDCGCETEDRELIGE